MKFSLGYEMQEDCPTLKKYQSIINYALEKNQQRKNSTLYSVQLLFFIGSLFSSVHQN